MCQNLTTTIIFNINKLQSDYSNAGPLWLEFSHMPNEKCHGHVGWMPRLACPVLTGWRGGKSDPTIISSFPGSPPCACLSADRGGELHSLKREHGTIERSEISPGHSNASQNSRDLLGGKQKDGGDGAPRAKPVVPPQAYPPTPLSAEALRYAGAKASEGYPPVAKSAEAVIPRFRISTDTAHAFIHGQSPWSSA